MILSDLAKYLMIQSVARSLRQLSFLSFSSSRMVNGDHNFTG